ncbi:hypothetical protein [Halosolutus gelatinilyticus]|uniref:hypothetical protein n=1 Tax=Halosolutus gelatinilyticus TaxID=2931975 RepID=UPI001FF63657|nr:hypothetical protein [Halosolutus gelatinilyticus]
MLDRRSIISVILGSFTGALSGCSKMITNDDPSSGTSNDSNNSNEDHKSNKPDDTDGISSEFNIIQSKCMSEESADELEEYNDAVIEFYDDLIHIEGTIADGEPNRIAELRDYEMDWSNSYLYIDVFHVEKENDNGKNCPSETAYEIDFEYKIPQDRAKRVRVKHNGRTAGKAEFEG